MAKLNWIPYGFGAHGFPNATITAHFSGWRAVRYYGDTSEVLVEAIGPHSIAVVVYHAADDECERIGNILTAARAEILRRGPCNFCGEPTPGNVCKACIDPRGAACPGCDGKDGEHTFGCEHGRTAEDVAEAMACR